MFYAFLGDVHSSKEYLEIVLAHIRENEPSAVIVGTGDLYECTISKKDISSHKFTQLEDVMIIPKGFNDLLSFPSVIGNQEERIILITDTNDSLRNKLQAMPETIQLEQAEIIHGHQWKWGGKPWSLLQAEINHSLTFYGHSHHSALTINGISQNIEFGTPYVLEGREILVNVGAVNKDKEWTLYDTSQNTVTFMRAE